MRVSDSVEDECGEAEEDECGEAEEDDDDDDDEEGDEDDACTDEELAYSKEAVCVGFADSHCPFGSKQSTLRE